jgi:dihydropteroate synthase
LSEYSGNNPQEIGWRLVKDKAFSDPSHALYLGGQLERAWRALRLGREYVQDKTAPT